MCGYGSRDFAGVTRTNVEITSSLAANSEKNYQARTFLALKKHYCTVIIPFFSFFFGAAKFGTSFITLIKRKENYPYIGNSDVIGCIP
jgi:hypothetical protein